MRRNERVEINPQVMFGKPVIRDTRITVEQILRAPERHGARQAT